jgi:group I intron endonuclease
MNKISGVYKITNTITGDFYIGSSKNIKRRWITHKCPSHWARYSNSKLYQDMNQYGLNNFTFEILEETVGLKEREQYWIDQLGPTYNNYRATGRDIDRYKETSRKVTKEWSESHHNESLARCKEYRESHREEIQAKSNKLCLYNGETLKLKALSQRLYRQGIVHTWLEAKKYIIK